MAERKTSKRGEAMVKGYKDPDSCPIATLDVEVNLKNRNHAIDEYGYGPLNPEEDNAEFWERLGDMWGMDPEEAKTSRCGNCAAFIQTPMMMGCIEKGLSGHEADKGDTPETKNAKIVSDAANLGYCQLFHFKCAGARTCDAWLFGGPVK